LHDAPFKEGSERQGETTAKNFQEIKTDISIAQPKCPRRENSFTPNCHNMTEM